MLLSTILQYAFCILLVQLSGGFTPIPNRPILRGNNINVPSTHHPFSSLHAGNDDDNHQHLEHLEHLENSFHQDDGFEHNEPGGDFKNQEEYYERTWAVEQQMDDLKTSYYEFFKEMEKGFYTTWKAADKKCIGMKWESHWYKTAKEALQALEKNIM